MESKWKKVFSSDQEYRVNLINQILNEEGIKSVMVNKKDSAYQIGKVELFVEQENVLNTLHIINKLSF